MTRTALSKTFLAGLALACATPVLAQELSGPADVVDGDTLTMGDMRIRLFGIDAPELKQSCDRDGEAWACGEAAKQELAALIQGHSVTCHGRENDAYGRLVATCRVGRLDLAEALVGAGWATAYQESSQDYLDRESKAKQFKLGLWAASFESPSAWRAAHPKEAPKVERVAAAPRASKPVLYRDRAGGCLIKGNHSRKGEWIYHLPGQAYYDQTRPEALFCTEEEAQRAGYRRSKV